jgi:hypothetical protein
MQRVLILTAVVYVRVVCCLSLVFSDAICKVAMLRMQAIVWRCLLDIGT